MNNIKELHELIYAGAILIFEKISVPPKNMNRNSKPWWEIRLETQIRNPGQPAKMSRQRKNVGICGGKREKQNNK